MALPNIPDPLRGRTAPEHWVALPRELLQRLSAFRSLAELKVVLYVLEHTYGYREYAAMKAITLDEFEHGRKRADGSRMDEGTGLSRAAIKLGLKQAKEDHFLYEVVDDHDRARIVRWYAVQLPSDGPASGIISSPQRDSFQPPVGQHLSPGGIDSSPRSEKDTLERNQEKDTLENMSDVTVVHDADALAQRLADQRLLQQLLAEQEQLELLRPSQRGWGAAQRGLRFLAPEIARLQALVTPQAAEPCSAAPSTVSVQVEPAEERRSPPGTRPLRLVSTPAASAEATPAPDTRRQRLMQLQSELARLKRTPSMRLLARQRIPQLEAEIKQMITELQESA